MDRSCTCRRFRAATELDGLSRGWGAATPIGNRCCLWAAKRHRHCGYRWPCHLGLCNSYCLSPRLLHHSHLIRLTSASWCWTRAGNCCGKTSHAPSAHESGTHATTARTSGLWEQVGKQSSSIHATLSFSSELALYSADELPAPGLSRQLDLPSLPSLLSLRASAFSRRPQSR